MILTGKRLQYLIGADDERPLPGADDVITVVPYDAPRAKHGISIGYCNLFDEFNTGKLGPYLHSSDTADEYNEGQINPRGPGWGLNLNVQFGRRRLQGFEYIELDNADAYSVEDVISAINLAGLYGLKVFAKNPLLVPGNNAYLGHVNVPGAIVEHDCGHPIGMARLRKEVGKPDLPVWFVAFGTAGKRWATSIAKEAHKYTNMFVSYSRHGEYETSEHIT